MAALDAAIQSAGAAAGCEAGGMDRPINPRVEPEEGDDVRGKACVGAMTRKGVIISAL
jgi:hypothetical protein